MAVLVGAAVFFFLITIVLVVMSMNIYNSFVQMRNEVKKAWANIDVILKQRFDEIPQLVEVIEQYVSHEKSIITQLTEARTRYGSARNPEQKMQAEGQLSLALQGIMAIGESYPELKSSDQFVQLNKRISELEESLAHRREFYNDSVNIFNTKQDQIPDLFIARIMNLSKSTFFEVAEAEKKRPSVKMKTIKTE